MRLRDKIQPGQTLPHLSEMPKHGPRPPTPHRLPLETGRGRRGLLVPPSSLFLVAAGVEKPLSGVHRFHSPGRPDLRLLPPRKPPGVFMRLSNKVQPGQAHPRLGQPAKNGPWSPVPNRLPLETGRGRRGLLVPPSSLFLVAAGVEKPRSCQACTGSTPRAALISASSHAGSCRAYSCACATKSNPARFIHASVSRRKTGPGLPSPTVCPSKLAAVGTLPPAHARRNAAVS